MCVLENIQYLGTDTAFDLDLQVCHYNVHQYSLNLVLVHFYDPF